MAAFAYPAALGRPSPYAGLYFVFFLLAGIVLMAAFVGVGSRTLFDPATGWAETPVTSVMVFVALVYGLLDAPGWLYLLLGLVLATAGWVWLRHIAYRATCKQLWRHLPGDIRFDRATALKQKTSRELREQVLAGQTDVASVLVQSWLLDQAVAEQNRIAELVNAFARRRPFVALQAEWRQFAAMCDLSRDGDYQQAKRSLERFVELAKVGPTLLREPVLG